MVYSASNVVAKEKFNDSLYYFKRQLLYLVIGYILMFIIIKSDIIKITNYINIIFLFCLSLLILVLIPGIGLVRGGVRSWIGIGGFSIQPSEFMKLGLVGLYAKYLSEHHKDLQKLKNFIMLFSLAGVIFLIIMLQPDFGTGLVIVLSAAAMIYISGVPNKYFVVIITIGLVGASLLILSAPYRIERILAFINPWEIHSEVVSKVFNHFLRLLQVAYLAMDLI